MEVLGCWRGALIPTSPEPGLAEEAARLHPQLCRCGWRDSDPTLLKVPGLGQGFGGGWGRILGS